MVKDGNEWCASIDLSSFFDEIPHNLIFKLIRRKIADERLLTLVARMLKAGIVENGKYKEDDQGMPTRLSTFTHDFEHRSKRARSRA
jgi:RNA-directed DNA polymerase